MRHLVPTQVKEALDAEKEARRLVSEGRFSEAEQILRRLRDASRAAGIGHAVISHYLSFVLFRQDRLEEALDLECEAIAIEPLNREFHDGFGAVVQRMREVIEVADLPPEDPRIPRFHALLAREVEETTVETHLALLRHLCAVGERAEADGFSKALSVLYPGHPEVWRYRAGIETGSDRPDDERSGALAMLSLLPAVKTMA